MKTYTYHECALNILPCAFEHFLAWHLEARADWPDLSPEARKNKGTTRTIHELGKDRVRISVHWAEVTTYNDRGEREAFTYPESLSLEYANEVISNIPAVKAAREAEHFGRMSGIAPHDELQAEAEFDAVLTHAREANHAWLVGQHDWTLVAESDKSPRYICDGCEHCNGQRYGADDELIAQLEDLTDYMNPEELAETKATIAKWLGPCDN